MSKTILYRQVPHNGGYVFASEDRAKHVAQIHDALTRAKTWGELARLLPVGEFDLIMSDLNDAGENLPIPSDPFDPEQILGWSDGDYPVWLQAEMDGLLSKVPMRSIAERKHTAVNGSFWHINEGAAMKVAQLLRRQGFSVRKAQRLKFA